MVKGKTAKKVWVATKISGAGHTDMVAGSVKSVVLKKIGSSARRYLLAKKRTTGDVVFLNGKDGTWSVKETEMLRPERGFKAGDKGNRKIER